MKAELVLIQPEGPVYAEELELRFRVLREPLGMPRESVAFPFEEQSLHWVALEAGHVVGCVLFRPQGSQSGRLFQMAVDPGRQRTGIGAALVKELEQRVRERGFGEVTLHARAAVLPFYEGLGYEVVGEPFTEVGIPHRHMRKALTATDRRR